MLNRKISIFANYMATQGKVTKLGDFLFNDDLRLKVDEIRAIEDKNERDRRKSLLPGATISGIFEGGRKKENLVAHSGLICIDIDAKDNPHINDWQLLKQQLSVIPCIGYMGLSVSGKGIFAIIPISDPDAHKAHFFSLQKDFAECGIVIDSSCSDLTRLRGCSYDTDFYLNNHPATYEKKLQEPSKHITYNAINWDKATAPEMVRNAVRKICSSGIDITDNYADWVQVGMALATLGEDGREPFHLVSQQSDKYNFRECDKKFSNLIKTANGSIGIGSFFHLCSQHGITYHSAPTTAIEPPRTAQDERTDIYTAYSPQHWLERIIKRNPAVGEMVQRLELEIVGDDIQPF